MSRQSDLLGLILDTATQQADDDPTSDGRGYTTLQSPMSDNESDENDDDTAYAALLDTGLPPEEAQETVNYMRPLNEEESDILDSTPLLDGLYRVDDAEHEQWMAEKAGQGYKAMDRVTEDAVYGETDRANNGETDMANNGETDMANNEERLERSDSDSESGFGFKRAFRKIGRGLKKSMKVAAFPMTKVMSTAAHFIPGRDARKARLVKNTYKKLWYEHANWLALQDKNAGIPLKPRGDYERVSKLWAVDQMRQHKLPTNFSTSGADILGAQILGNEIVGSWAWPFGNFLNFSRTTVKDTADKRASQPPVEQADQSQPPQMDDVNDPSLAIATPDSEPPASDDQVPQPDSQGETMHGTSDDTLGAFATQILGTPAKDNPYAEKIVQVIAAKLKSRQPITPSDLGLLASASKEGNISAQKVMVALESRGVAIPADTSGLDPWMYKLSPSYWLASKKKKEFIDSEKKSWMENYRLQKELSKKQEVLQQAEKAKQAHETVAAAQAQAADTEAQLQAISDSLKGVMSGSFVGHEKITPIAQVVVNALEKTGKKETAGKLYSKIKAGQALTKDELKDARQIANLIGRLRVVHGDLIDENYATYAMHGAFVGTCVMGGIDIAQNQNSQHGQFADDMAKKIASGQALTQDERNQLAKVLCQQKNLRKFTASIVSGRAFAGCPEKKSWTKGAFVGAVKSLSPEDKKMLGAIAKLSKLGNPRAQKALAALRKSGEIMGGNTFVGSGIKKFFKYATAPIWLPAKGVYKGAQAFGLASKGGGANPEQARLARLRAAYKRKQAAAARAAAADSQSEAEQRAQLALADAADAEADANDAEAMSKEEKMRTAEVEANPDMLVTGESGTFIGATDAELDQLAKSSYGKSNAKHVQILKKANEKTPTGTKIRAGATLYAKSQSKNPKIRQPADRAIRIMAAKAQKGDQQAKRDINAVKAGRIAYRTKQSMAIMKNDLKVQKRKEALAVRAARNAKLIAIRKRYEAGIANRLARASRKHELNKLAKVERMAAQGHPKARAFVALRMSAAHKGDKKAQAQVRGMQLGKCMRTQVTSRRERQNMQFASAMAKRLAKNDPRAIRQLGIWQAAASKGNPNAIRCMKRLALAGAVLTTIATGSVVLPKAIGSKGKKRLAPGTSAYAKAQKQVAQAKKKASSGAGSREELIAAAKTASQLGDKQSAGQLANAASNAPSTTERLKKEASKVAAAQSGNAEAQDSLNKSLETAKQGDVDGINTLGHVLAVKTVDAANKGQPIPPVVTEGINLQARAKSGDVAAQETLQRVSEAATQPNPPPEATLAAAGAVAGAVLGSALDGKPGAQRELMEKVNPPIPAGEKSAAQAEVAAAVAKANDGTITPEEAVKAEALAMRLNQPKLAAEIAAKSPPMEYDSMSTLPNMPLAPIQGTWQLVKEVAKALTLTTKDPIANYREGVQTRGKPSTETTSSGSWSPFRMFMKANKLAVLAPLIPGVAPIAATAAAATGVVNLAKGRKTEQKPEPQPVATAAPVAAPVAAPAKTSPEAETPEAPPEKITSTATSGTFVGTDKPKTGVAKPKGKVSPAQKDEFKKLVVAALKTKKMSRNDFNQAVISHVPADATKEVKAAAGEKMLGFLTKKGVKIG
jgi:hypothetical protein